MVIDFNVKLGSKKDIDESIIKAIDDGKVHPVKLSTNRLLVEKDSKDNRLIKDVKNIKVMYKLKEGTLMVQGSLQCSFVPPYGGQLYIYKTQLLRELNYDTINGQEATMLFTNNPCSIDDMRAKLYKLTQSSDFIFNIEQFEDFMELFEYYKSLSTELNNSAHYIIRKTSQPYHTITVDAKDLYDEQGNLHSDYELLDPIYNQNELLLGYRVEPYIYEGMPNNLQEQVQEWMDLEVDNLDGAYRMISKMKEDLYISNGQELQFTTKSKLFNLTFKNLVRSGDVLKLSVLYERDITEHYLNLYDMGQKIKVDSIDNSLKLIRQGATGMAVELIEYLIGDKPIPQHNHAIISGVMSKYTQHLNASQKKAFLKAIDPSPVTLIKGPPGTGKTHVINAITQYITKELKQRVVISSQTHIAIDNVLDKLMENYDLVIPNRITNRYNRYSADSIDKTLYQTWARKFESHNARTKNQAMAGKIAEDMKNFNGAPLFQYSTEIDESSYMVIGATTTTPAIGGKKGLELLKEYQWLIIDEVSKCPITEVLRYLPYIEKIILVGDDLQLAPLMEFEKESVKDLQVYNEDKFDKLKAVYENSIFAKTMSKAEASDRLVLLEENYRSVQDVLRAYNIFYDFQLVSRREEVNPTTIRFHDKMNYLNESAIAFVDVKGGKEITEGTSRYNVEELVATAHFLEEIIKHVEHPNTVSVAAIFPYAAQISKFTKDYRDLINQAKRLFKSFDVDTVDAFQGKESDIVIVNTVVTDSSKRNFLSDFRRINVSMSRARDKLIIFGNKITLSRISMKISDGNKRRFFKEIIEDIQRYGQMIEYSAERGLQLESSIKSKIVLA